MLSPEEIEIAKFGKEQGKSQQEVLSALSRYRQSVTTQKAPEKTGGFIQTAKDLGIGFAKGAGDSLNALHGLGSAVQRAIDPTKGNKFSSNAPIFDKEKLKADNTTQKVGKFAEFAAEVLVPAGTPKKIIDTAAKGAQGLSRLTKPLLDKSVDLVKSGKIKNVLSPEKNLPDAIGEILQGKPGDIKKGIDTFKNIDTSTVKTFKDLELKIDDSIRTLSEKVDNVLGADESVTKLDQLASKIKTKTGMEVSANYVQTALNHLDELYQKTGDIAAQADLKSLMEKATNEGLSKLEINDISRIYNSEFGTKAFSKMGDALTSVNAQLYENIRKGLKVKAREGLGGGEAAATDKIISSLYNTKKLVAKNVEAVNKLKQKIADRGLLEKAGHAIAKYSDILTGGSIRGLIGGLLPRGAGYKVMNALDLEERLTKNLDVIEKALNTASDTEMVKILEGLLKK